MKKDVNVCVNKTYIKVLNRIFVLHFLFVILLTSLCLATDGGKEQAMNTFSIIIALVLALPILTCIIFFAILIKVLTAIGEKLTGKKKTIYIIVSSSLVGILIVFLLLYVFHRLMG